MAEPTEFYKIRDEAVPRAPPTLIGFSSLFILVGSFILFVYLSVTGSQSFIIETDIFQSAELNTEQWDQCVPTTTLGTIWSFQTLSFQDDCVKRLHFNVQSMYFPDVDTCVKTLAAPLHTNGICSPDLTLVGGTSSGDMCANTMPFYDVSKYPMREGFLSYSCNGVPMNCTTGGIYAASATRGDGTTSLCPHNFMKLEFDYSMPAMAAANMPTEWQTDCINLMKPLCKAIYASGNPYKCTRKKFQTVWDAVASAFAFTTLAREAFVICLTVCFSLFFASQFYEAKTAHSPSSSHRRASVSALLKKEVV